MPRAESAQDVVDLVRKDASFRDRVKADPEVALAEVATPLQSDVWIYRIVVVALAVIVIGALGGGVGLSAAKLDVPDLLVAFGSGALGALTGLLAPSPASRK